MMPPRKLALFLMAVTMGYPVAHGVESRTAYVIDSQKSKIEVQVAREGFFKAFGHDHLISAKEFSGEVQLDSAKLENSSVSFTIEAKSLSVVDPGESEKDRKDVQDTMLGEQVLDVGRYPQIQFSSSSVKVVSNKKGIYELQVEGTLSLHGAKKPVTTPVRAQIMKDGTLSVYAEVPLLQSDYGITPVKVAGGTVRVKDRLKLTFQILAGKAS